MALPLKARPGQTLDDRFLLIEELGRGGMATVFLAEDLENERRPVAVKVPLPQYASGLGSWSMSQREAEIGESLEHPSVLRFIAAPANKARRYIVTEYVAGSTLASRLGGGRRMESDEARAIVSRLCDAVEHLHRRQFVHYDLKPDNVLLGSDGSIRLIDFGLAHARAKSRFAFSGGAPTIASAQYVAPEQLGRRRGQPSVDIYALGAMLYEMLTGHPPFEGDDPFVVASARRIGDPRAPRALNPAISPAIEEIVLRALRRNPAERYASAAALKADLDAPERVRVSGLAERLVEVTAGRVMLRWLRFLAITAVAPVAFLGALFGWLWMYFAHHPRLR